MLPQLPHFVATFRQPRFNPLGIKVPSPIQIEIYPKRQDARKPLWLARVKINRVGLTIQDHDLETAKCQVQALYEEELTAWRPVTPDGHPLALPENWIPTGGRTHAAHEKQRDRGLCGLSVPRSSIVPDDDTPVTCLNCLEALRHRHRKRSNG